MDAVNMWREGFELMCDFGKVERFDSWSHAAPERCIHIDGQPPSIIRVDAHSSSQIPACPVWWVDRFYFFECYARRSGDYLTLGVDHVGDEGAPAGRWTWRLYRASWRHDRDKDDYRACIGVWPD
jgi:hypothetical protein